MNVELNTAYIAASDCVVYPIHKLNDTDYICICYSCNHSVYSLDLYSAKTLEEYGYTPDEYNDELFDRIAKEDLLI